MKVLQIVRFLILTLPIVIGLFHLCLMSIQIWKQHYFDDSVTATTIVFTIIHLIMFLKEFLKMVGLKTKKAKQKKMWFVILFAVLGLALTIYKLYTAYRVFGDIPSQDNRWFNITFETLNWILLIAYIVDIVVWVFRWRNLQEYQDNYEKLEETVNR